MREDGDVATRLHQEGSYTMLNRPRVDVAVAEPVRKQKTTSLGSSGDCGGRGHSIKQDQG